jgi:phosphinothricin acetyltransferase
MPATLRAATETDVEAITAIYAHHVLHSTGTFETEPPSAIEMATRFAKITGAGYPYLVATAGDTIAGFGYLGPFRERRAYRLTAENSIYVHPDHIGKGIGKELLAGLIKIAEQGNYTQIVALIGDSQNLASINLHARAGFVQTGVMSGVGFKFDRWLDVTIMQLVLK